MTVRISIKNEDESMRTVTVEEFSSVEPKGRIRINELCSKEGMDVYAHSGNYFKIQERIE